MNRPFAAPAAKDGPVSFRVRILRYDEDWQLAGDDILQIQKLFRLKE